MHWTASCPRLLPHEFAARSTYGEVADTTLVDWPLSYDEIAPWYDRAEDRLGVTGTHGIPMLPGNNNYKVLEAGARRCGYTDVDTNHMAINPQPRDGRPGCQQLGFCTSGCAVGAKWSTLYTEIPRGEKTGRLELRTEVFATRIHVDANGRATGVTYRDAKGVERMQKAVCVAGNVVETTRLLLNSRTDSLPQGVANSSGLVGRNYMRHVSVQVIGLMPGPVDFHRGAHVAGIVKDERVFRPERGFVGGFIMHTVPFTPEILAKNLMPGVWGPELTRVLDRYRNLAGLLICGEDLPQASNRVYLHPTEKDEHGLPVPVVHYERHPNSIALKSYAWGRGRRIYESLGATDVFEMGDNIPATHNMGAARMGTDPRASVCNPYGQTHDVANLFVSDGSLFPTSGSGNPTLTIVALALRQAEHIAGRMRANRL
jgi:choline dehydrogenase-like flavoprotein